MSRDTGGKAFDGTGPPLQMGLVSCSCCRSHPRLLFCSVRPSDRTLRSRNLISILSHLRMMRLSGYRSSLHSWLGKARSVARGGKVLKRGLCGMTVHEILLCKRLFERILAALLLAGGGSWPRVATGPTTVTAGSMLPQTQPATQWAVRAGAVPLRRVNGGYAVRYAVRHAVRHAARQRAQSAAEAGLLGLSLLWLKGRSGASKQACAVERCVVFTPARRAWNPPAKKACRPPRILAYAAASLAADAVDEALEARRRPD